MNESTAFAAVTEILEEVGEIDPASVTLDSELSNDLDVDSLLLVEITVVAGEKYAIEIPDDELAEVVTVRDLVGLLSKAHVPA